ncbi:ion transporter [Candidatus Finniella inopinata]|uniref:Ion transporter n=1 Tax=Candidatus Finniella inopinata TaxID=1696036 RepID=A0A4Q7DJV6_9PROT|nr:ion transporter [Candidatus Finniella inopinata]RZI46559.1 ion transporter [Candidatus Finniella inopinata]
MPRMRVIVASVSRALPGILSVAVILLLSFYVASIIAYNLFSSDAEYFGTLGGTMFTLFQLMLADDWGNILRTLSKTYPHCYLFFVPFMVLVTFTVLNLFFGLIVNSMQQAAEAENKSLEGPDEEDESSLRDEIRGLKEQLEEIKKIISR